MQIAGQDKRRSKRTSMEQFTPAVLYLARSYRTREARHPKGQLEIRMEWTRQVGACSCDDQSASLVFQAWRLCESLGGYIRGCYLDISFQRVLTSTTALLLV